MKNIYTLSILLVLSLSSFAKTFYIYTAKKSGDWDNSGTWNVVVRNDNVQKDKFIIPSSFTVTADEDVNNMGYSDVELQISGTLKLGSSATLYFGNNSSIQVLSTGSIDANGASQQIYIGAISKYVGNKNKTLTGPVYADFSTGAAPLGFSTFSLLSINNQTPAVTRQRDEDKSPIIYASGKNIRITVRGEVRSLITVNVMNMNGEVVASETFNKPSSNLSIKLSQLKSGVYVVYLTGNNAATTVQKVFLN